MSDYDSPQTGTQPIAELTAPVRVGQVQVWAAHLPTIAGGSVLRAALQSTLSAEERANAHRLRRAEDRDRAILGRGMLRVILGRALHADPVQLTITTGPHGKPGLASPQAHAPAFNVTHSGAWWMLALGPPGMALGVDVEAHREIRDWPDIAARYFHPAECAALQKLPAPLQGAAFFDCWTRKEAVAKALGLGLSIDVSTFVVPLQPLTAPVPVSLADPTTAGRCELWPGIKAPPGYSVALCCAGDQRPVDLRQAEIRPDMLLGH